MTVYETLRRRSVATVVAIFILVIAQLVPGAVNRVKASPLGAYGQLSTYCGNGAIPRDPVSIPALGCFYLSANQSASGDFVGHRIRLTVDALGSETYAVDGTTILSTGIRSTNVADVKPSSSGYALCLPDGDKCPIRLDVFSRNPDHTVLFTVSQCAPPQYKVCAITPENYEYAKSHSDDRSSSPFTPAPGDTALTRVSKICGFLSAMGMDGYKGPKDVGETYVTSLYATCLAHAMPPDWPDAATTLKRGQQLYREAHAKYSDIPDPETLSATFEKIRVQPPK